jgi:pyocin large subunit-like protein
VSSVARTNGDTLFYKAATNEFAVVTKSGVIRTYFKPEKGLQYWFDQVEKAKQ